MNTQPKKALIYCRVSSKRQAADGSGLESQEHRCRDYAATRGYDVEAVFPDDRSGGGDFMARPGMVALLAYMDAKPDENYVVIFDDLKRYARDTEFHLKLKREMSARGAIRECLNFKFEDSAEGEFIETIMAAQGELERKQNRRQVIQKMKARVEQGYWAFRPPVGYRYQKARHGGKILVRDEPLASVVQEGLEGYASGRFSTQSEVKSFFESVPAFRKDKRGQVHQQRVADILSRAIYAGYVGIPEWQVPLRKGRHEPLISLDTFEKIQKRREGRANVPMRKNIHQDFVLRGFVLCSDCGKPFTSCWSKGRRQKYPYYLCDTKGCVSYRKSIRRDDIEGAFAGIVHTLKPTKTLFDMAKAMFKSAWDQRAKQAKHIADQFKTEINQAEKQIAQLLERIVNTENPTIINAYEQKIAQLERNRLIASEKLQSGPVPKGHYDRFIEHTLNFLANPAKLWDSGDFAMRRTVLKLAFTERIAYDRKIGYRTAKISLPFKVLEDIRTGDCEMVVEPVCCEPVSARGFPVFREFTGSFARFIVNSGQFLRFSIGFTESCREFP